MAVFGRPIYTLIPWIFGLIVVIPVLKVIVTSIGVDWYPVGDNAMIALSAHDVGTENTRLVGPYSRYGWNHPGALMWFVLAAPYRLLANNPWALMVGAGLVHLVAASGVLWFAWRHGRLQMLTITGACLSILLVSMGTDLLEDVWNPNITLIVFVLFLFSSWAAIRRDLAGVIVSVFSGAFLVQSHIGYALTVGVIWLIVAGYLLYRRDGKGVIWAGFIMALCWLPVLFDQFFAMGNVSKLLDYFGSDHHVVGLGNAIEIASRELVGDAPWLGGRETAPWAGVVDGRAAWQLIAPCLLFFASLFFAYRRNQQAAVQFQLIVLVTALLGVISVSRISDFADAYLVRWWWPLAMCWWLSIAYSVTETSRTNRISIAPRTGMDVPIVAFWVSFASRVRPIVIAVVALILVSGNSAFALAMDDLPNGPNAEFYQGMDAITDATVSAVRNVETPILLRGTGPEGGWYGDGLAFQLEKRGTQVVVDPIGLVKYGERRIVGDEPPVYELLVATGTAIDEVKTDDHLRKIAGWVKAPDHPKNVSVYLVGPTSATDAFP